MEHDELVARAREVMERAYAPYSGFRVGAALLGDDGSVHTGCNVENASYGLTICAERAAVGAAVARGVRRLRAAAIATSGSEPVPPCGACRQVLAEFSPTMTIVSVAGEGRKTWTLDRLLPEPFEPGNVR
ncbi:MAG TPA: cytidine deaminase [Longimicrobiales bacterium]|nr:cytidine deaminase [Longimicrobiales bacterium]